MSAVSLAMPWYPITVSPMSAPRDPAADLLRRHAAGDELAFARLVDEHQSAGFACAVAVCGDREAAADVLQEAFLRLLHHGDRYDGVRPFRPFFLQIVRNLAIDVLRRRRPHADAGELQLAAPDRHPGHATEQAEMRLRVARVLGSLPEKYRDILIMREMEGISAEAIAEQIGVEYGTTRWRLHEARRLFREQWTTIYGEEV